MSTVGLVVPGDIWSARSEQFLNQVLAGIEDVVVAAGHTVLTHAAGSVEQEIAVHRRWAAEGAVRAVVLRDLGAEDPRPGILRGLGLPYVLIGDVVQEDGPGAGVPTVSVDNAGIMREVLGTLLEMGHRRIVHVGGPPHLLHSALRRAAYREVMAREGLEDLGVDGDYSRASGAAALDALRPLLQGVPATEPTAPSRAVIVLDNDAMALGALERARELRLRVPEDVSLVSWEDSMGCQLSEPPMTALGHALRSTGMQVGRALAHLVEDPPRVVRHRPSTPVLLRRETLAGTPAPAPTSR